MFSNLTPLRQRILLGTLIAFGAILALAYTVGGR